MAKSDSIKAEIRRAFAGEVRAALDDAYRAAVDAAAAVKNTATLNEQGQIMGELGSVLFGVHAPSFRLRRALKELGEIEHSDRGAWAISGFPHVGQALIAQEAACSAARVLMAERFPGEGYFFCETWEN